MFLASDALSVRQACKPLYVAVDYKLAVGDYLRRSLSRMAAPISIVR